MWHDDLKAAGVNIHVAATGAGAGLQQKLWSIPGSSAYLSGASFPYSQEEHSELLGFEPDKFCSPEDAIDLASAAYMKAASLSGKKPVGVGITASVASERAHRGDHRFHIAVITDDKTLAINAILEKGIGQEARTKDGDLCDDAGFHLTLAALGLFQGDLFYEDATELAMKRFMEHPFFTSNGHRHIEPQLEGCALMSGAYNPPHAGHFGTADACEAEFNRKVVFEITTNSPHKGALKVQDLLRRAKLLQGRDRLFTWSNPLYLDKARAYPGIPIVMGADALIRMLDPKWGPNVLDMMKEFYELGTKFYVCGRMVDGKFTTLTDILMKLPEKEADWYWNDPKKTIFLPLDGRWDLSSTDLRNQVK
jgi:nicotinamide mononucleotide (NMN) deamidase PncC